MVSILSSLLVLIGMLTFMIFKSLNQREDIFDKLEDLERE